METDNQIETNNAQLHNDRLSEKQDGSYRLAVHNERSNTSTWYTEKEKTEEASILDIYLSDKSYNLIITHNTLMATVTESNSYAMLSIGVFWQLYQWNKIYTPSYI